MIMKRTTIIGSTGSIGTQALEVIEKFPKYFKVIGLTGWENIKLLAEQIRKFKPQYVSVKDEISKEKLKNILPRPILQMGTPQPKIFCGEKGIEEIAKVPVDICVISTVGISGLYPTLTAIKNSKTVALANKEALVVAGKIVMKYSQRYKTKIIPVDSEHSAIFQCLQGKKQKDIDKIILTCSGGPFLRYSKSKMEQVRPRETLRHPTWKMGKKITVDSATLINKGFEVIEAMHLFKVPLNKIEVVIHPQSIVHSLVKFVDGSYLGHLSYPDMRLPLQYALFYPERKGCLITKEIDFDGLNLSFEKLPQEKFPCFNLAKYSAKLGGSAPVVLNAANEVSVDLFLKGKIKFTDIAKIIEKALNFHQIIKNPSLQNIKKIDEEIRRKIKADLFC